jgi:hypothetical protein
MLSFGTAFAGLAYLAVFPTAIATIFANHSGSARGTTIFITGQLSGAGLGGGHRRACS